MNTNPFQRALDRERRTYDAIDRTIQVLQQHPELDPAERVHLIRTLSNIDRRKI